MMSSTQIGMKRNRWAWGKELDRLGNLEKRFVRLFLLCLIISFSPAKAIGQILPVVFLAGLIFYVRLLPFQNIKRFFVVFAVYSAMGLVYSALDPGFLYLNFYAFFLTAGSTWVLFLNLDRVATKPVLQKLASILVSVILFEAVYGLVQVGFNVMRRGTFDGDVGDALRGTIAPGFAESPGRAANVIFVLLLSSFLIFAMGVLPFKKALRISLAFIVGTVAWVLASVLHTIILFMAALCMTSLLFGIRRASERGPRFGKRGRAWVALAVILLGLGPLILPENFGNIPSYIQKTLEIHPEAYSPKARMIYFTLNEIPENNPVKWLVGTGPGQFCSRAALILTGEYLAGRNIYVEPSIGPLTSKYVIPLLLLFSEEKMTGSTLFPFSSWISLAVETGMLGIVIVIWAVSRGSRCFLRKGSSALPNLGFGAHVLMIYILLLGFQDNYWEFTQAVFLPILLIVLAYRYLQLGGQRMKPAPAARKGL